MELVSRFPFKFIFNIILRSKLPWEKKVFMRSRVLLINHLENSPENKSLILTLFSVVKLSQSRDHFHQTDFCQISSKHTDGPGQPRPHCLNIKLNILDRKTFNINKNISVNCYNTFQIFILYHWCPYGQWTKKWPKVKTPRKHCFEDLSNHWGSFL